MPEIPSMSTEMNTRMGSWAAPTEAVNATSVSARGSADFMASILPRDAWAFVGISREALRISRWCARYLRRLTLPGDMREKCRMKQIVWALLTVAACSSPSATPPGIDLSTARLVDLSYTYDEDTLYWPTSPTSFELEELAYGVNDAGYFYSAYSFCTPEHGGTHLDAPIHFAEGGRTVGEIPVRQLIAPGVVIDMSATAAQDADARLSVAAVTDWERRNGPVPEGAIVLLRTGWGSRWPDALSYLGDDTPGDASNLHFPAYGEDSARFLVEERRVGALGVDTASIDAGQATDFIAHQIAGGAGVANLENVANVDELPEKGFWVIALPVKIGKGSGGPVRIVAVIP